MSYTLMRRLLVVGITLVLAGCTAESTLKSLVEEFPKHKDEMNELRDLMLSLSNSTGNFQFLSDRIKGGKDDVVDFFDKEPRIFVSKAVNTTFKLHGDQLLRIQAVVHAVGIDYVSVDKEKKAVWVTLSGGGALASDKGYLYTGKDEIASFHLKRALPIPNENNWYAFD